MNARNVLFSARVAGLVVVPGLTDVAGDRAALVLFDGTTSDHRAGAAAAALVDLAHAGSLPVAFGVAEDIN